MLEPRPPSVAPHSTPAADGRVADDRTDGLAVEVAKAVRELRIALGLSERGAARLLSTSQTQLRRMEDPRYLPSLRSLAKLATAYGQRLRISFEARERSAAKTKREAPPVPTRARAASKPQKRTARTARTARRRTQGS